MVSTGELMLKKMFSLFSGRKITDDPLSEMTDHFKNKSLKYKKYVKMEHWDHDHCELCGITISEVKDDDHINEAYCNEESQGWVCRECFVKNKKEMGWVEE